MSFLKGAVRIKNNPLKIFLCVLLCTALVVCSIVNGEGAVLYLDSFLQMATTDNNLIIVSGDNENLGENGTIYNITGYGGGGYVNASANITPTDIETLKEQAKHLYKNYTKAGDIKETHMGVIFADAFT